MNFRIVYIVVSDLEKKKEVNCFNYYYINNMFYILESNFIMYLYLVFFKLNVLF